MSVTRQTIRATAEQSVIISTEVYTSEAYGRTETA